MAASSERVSALALLRGLADGLASAPSLTSQQAAALPATRSDVAFSRLWNLLDLAPPQGPPASAPLGFAPGLLGGVVSAGTPGAPAGSATLPVVDATATPALHLLVEDLAALLQVPSAYAMFLAVETEQTQPGCMGALEDGPSAAGPALQAALGTYLALRRAGLALLHALFARSEQIEQIDTTGPDCLATGSLSARARAVTTSLLEHHATSTTGGASPATFLTNAANLYCQLHRCTAEPGARVLKSLGPSAEASAWLVAWWEGAWASHLLDQQAALLELMYTAARLDPTHAGHAWKREALAVRALGLTSLTSAATEADASVETVAATRVFSAGLPEGPTVATPPPNPALDAHEFQVVLAALVDPAVSLAPLEEDVAGAASTPAATASRLPRLLAPSPAQLAKATAAFPSVYGANDTGARISRLGALLLLELMRLPWRLRVAPSEQQTSSRHLPHPSDLLAAAARPGAPRTPESDDPATFAGWSDRAMGLWWAPSHADAQDERSAQALARVAATVAAAAALGHAWVWTTAAAGRGVHLPPHVSLGELLSAPGGALGVPAAALEAAAAACPLTPVLLGWSAVLAAVAAQAPGFGGGASPLLAGDRASLAAAIVPAPAPASEEGAGWGGAPLQPASYFSFAAATASLQASVCGLRSARVSPASVAAMLALGARAADVDGAVASTRTLLAAAADELGTCDDGLARSAAAAARTDALVAHTAAASSALKHGVLGGENLPAAPLAFEAPLSALGAGGASGLLGDASSEALAGGLLCGAAGASTPAREALGLPSDSAVSSAAAAVDPAFGYYQGTALRLVTAVIGARRQTLASPADDAAGRLPLPLPAVQPPSASALLAAPSDAVSPAEDELAPLVSLLVAIYSGNAKLVDGLWSSGSLALAVAAAGAAGEAAAPRVDASAAAQEAGALAHQAVLARQGAQALPSSEVGVAASLATLLAQTTAWRLAERAGDQGWPFPPSGLGELVPVTAHVAARLARAHRAARAGGAPPSRPELDALLTSCQCLASLTLAGCGARRAAADAAAAVLYAALERYPHQLTPLASLGSALASSSAGASGLALLLSKCVGSVTHIVAVGGGAGNANSLTDGWLEAPSDTIDFYDAACTVAAKGLGASLAAGQVSGLPAPAGAVASQGWEAGCGAWGREGYTTATPGGMLGGALVLPGSSTKGALPSLLVKGRSTGGVALALSGPVDPRLAACSAGLLPGDAGVTSASSASSLRLAIQPLRHSAWEVLLGRLDTAARELPRALPALGAALGRSSGSHASDAEQVAVQTCFRLCSDAKALAALLASLCREAPAAFLEAALPGGHTATPAFTRLVSTLLSLASLGAEAATQPAAALGLPNYQSPALEQALREGVKALELAAAALRAVTALAAAAPEALLDALACLPAFGPWDVRAIEAGQGWGASAAVTPEAGALASLLVLGQTLLRSLRGAPAQEASVAAPLQLTLLRLLRVLVRACLGRAGHLEATALLPELASLPAPEDGAVSRAQLGALLHGVLGPHVSNAALGALIEASDPAHTGAASRPAVAAVLRSAWEAETGGGAALPAPLTPDAARELRAALVAHNPAARSHAARARTTQAVFVTGAVHAALSVVTAPLDWASAGEALRFLALTRAWTLLGDVLAYGGSSDCASPSRAVACAALCEARDALLRALLTDPTLSSALMCSATLLSSAALGARPCPSVDAVHLPINYSGLKDVVIPDAPTRALAHSLSRAALQVLVAVLGGLPSAAARPTFPALHGDGAGCTTLASLAAGAGVAAPPVCDPVTWHPATKAEVVLRHSVTAPSTTTGERVVVSGAIALAGLLGYHYDEEVAIDPTLVLAQFQSGDDAASFTYLPWATQEAGAAAARPAVTGASISALALTAFSLFVRCAAKASANVAAILRAGSSGSGGLAAAAVRYNVTSHFAREADGLAVELVPAFSKAFLATDAHHSLLASVAFPASRLLAALQLGVAVMDGPLFVLDTLVHASDETDAAALVSGDAAGRGSRRLMTKGGRFARHPSLVEAAAEVVAAAPQTLLPDSPAPAAAADELTRARLVATALALLCQLWRTDAEGGLWHAAVTRLRGDASLWKAVVKLASAPAPSAEAVLEATAFVPRGVVPASAAPGGGDFEDAEGASGAGSSSLAVALAAGSGNGLAALPPADPATGAPMPATLSSLRLHHTLVGATATLARSLALRLLALELMAHGQHQPAAATLPALLAELLKPSSAHGGAAPLLALVQGANAGLSATAAMTACATLSAAAAEAGLDLTAYFGVTGSAAATAAPSWIAPAAAGTANTEVTAASSAFASETAAPGAAFAAADDAAAGASAASAELLPAVAYGRAGPLAVDRLAADLGLSCEWVDALSCGGFVCWEPLVPGAPAGTGALQVSLNPAVVLGSVSAPALRDWASQPRRLLGLRLLWAATNWNAALASLDATARAAAAAAAFVSSLPLPRVPSAFPTSAAHLPSVVLPTALAFKVALAALQQTAACAKAGCTLSGASSTAGPAALSAPRLLVSAVASGAQTTLLLLGRALQVHLPDGGASPDLQLATFYSSKQFRTALVETALAVPGVDPQSFLGDWKAGETLDAARAALAGLPAPWAGSLAAVVAAAAAAAGSPAGATSEASLSGSSLGASGAFAQTAAGSKLGASASASLFSPVRLAAASRLAASTAGEGGAASAASRLFSPGATTSAAAAAAPAAALALPSALPDEADLRARLLLCSIACLACDGVAAAAQHKAADPAVAAHAAALAAGAMETAAIALLAPSLGAAVAPSPAACTELATSLFAAAGQLFNKALRLQTARGRSSAGSSGGPSSSPSKAAVDDTFPADDGGRFTLEELAGPTGPVVVDATAVPPLPEAGLDLSAAALAAQACAVVFRHTTTSVARALRRHAQDWLNFVSTHVVRLASALAWRESAAAAAAAADGARGMAAGAAAHSQFEAEASESLAALRRLSSPESVEADLPAASKAALAAATTLALSSVRAAQALAVFSEDARPRFAALLVETGMMDALVSCPLFNHAEAVVSEAAAARVGAWVGYPDDLGHGGSEGGDGCLLPQALRWPTTPGHVDGAASTALAALRAATAAASSAPAGAGAEAAARGPGAAAATALARSPAALYTALAAMAAPGAEGSAASSNGAAFAASALAAPGRFAGIRPAAVVFAGLGYGHGPSFDRGYTMAGDRAAPHLLWTEALQLLAAVTRGVVAARGDGGSLPPAAHRVPSLLVEGLRTYNATLHTALTARRSYTFAVAREQAAVCEVLAVAHSVAPLATPGGGPALTVWGAWRRAATYTASLPALLEFLIRDVVLVLGRPASLETVTPPSTKAGASGGGGNGGAGGVGGRSFSQIAAAMLAAKEEAEDDEEETELSLASPNAAGDESRRELAERFGVCVELVAPEERRIRTQKLTVATPRSAAARFAAVTGGELPADASAVPPMPAPAGRPVMVSMASAVSAGLPSVKKLLRAQRGGGSPAAEALAAAAAANGGLVLPGFVPILSEDDTVVAAFVPTLSAALQATAARATALLTSAALAAREGARARAAAASASTAARAAAATSDWQVVTLSAMLESADQAGTGLSSRLSSVKAQRESTLLAGSRGAAGFASPQPAAPGVGLLTSPLPFASPAPRDTRTGSDPEDLALASDLASSRAVLDATTRRLTAAATETQSAAVAAAATAAAAGAAALSGLGSPAARLRGSLASPTPASSRFGGGRAGAATPAAPVPEAAAEALPFSTVPYCEDAGVGAAYDRGLLSPPTLSHLLAAAMHLGGLYHKRLGTSTSTEASPTTPLLLAATAGHRPAAPLSVAPLRSGLAHALHILTGAVDAKARAPGLGYAPVQAGVVSVDAAARKLLTAVLDALGDGGVLYAATSGSSLASLEAAFPAEATAGAAAPPTWSAAEDISAGAAHAATSSGNRSRQASYASQDSMGSGIGGGEAGAGGAGEDARSMAPSTLRTGFSSSATFAAGTLSDSKGATSLASARERHQAYALRSLRLMQVFGGETEEEGGGAGSDRAFVRTVVMYMCTALSASTSAGTFERVIAGLEGELSASRGGVGWASATRRPVSPLGHAGGMHDGHPAPSPTTSAFASAATGVGRSGLRVRWA